MAPCFCRTSRTSLCALSAATCRAVMKLERERERETGIEQGERRSERERTRREEEREGEKETANVSSRSFWLHSR